MDRPDACCAINMQTGVKEVHHPIWKCGSSQTDSQPPVAKSAQHSSDRVRAFSASLSDLSGPLMRNSGSLQHLSETVNGSPATLFDVPARHGKISGGYRAELRTMALFQLLKLNLVSRKQAGFLFFPRGPRRIETKQTDIRERQNFVLQLRGSPALPMSAICRICVAICRIAVGIRGASVARLRICVASRNMDSVLRSNTCHGFNWIPKSGESGQQILPAGRHRAIRPVIGH
jgi:hypothetical protein